MLRACLPLRPLTQSIPDRTLACRAPTSPGRTFPPMRLRWPTPYALRLWVPQPWVTLKVAASLPVLLPLCRIHRSRETRPPPFRSSPKARSGQSRLCRNVHCPHRRFLPLSRALRCRRIREPSFPLISRPA